MHPPESGEQRPCASFLAVARFFNTAGPCDAERHYTLPPAERLPDARRLIDQFSYFVLHAPRQTGKTTTLRALASTLTAEGQFAGLHFSCEMGEVAGDDILSAQRAILASVRRRSEIALPAELRPPDPWPQAAPEAMLSTALSAWASRCPLPLVLFFDEIDALRGQSLLSVLRQLREGFADRPGAFPASIVLCGLRDVRDYKANSGGDPDRLGTASPFNIKVKSLRLGDFTEQEIRQLYAQHTAETSQPFIDEALRRVWELTQGQPWLVNALAREVTEEIDLDPGASIGIEHVEIAKERLILARATHLDSLVARLQEPRVRRVLEPLITGESAEREATYDDDVAFCRDLGLIAGRPPRVANPIYREVIVRVLSTFAEDQVELEPRSFVLADGRLDFRRFLSEFLAFWREHGDTLAGSMPYPELAPQLVLMAYLQRVVNGGGYVDREYGVGRGRIDLLVRWPWRDGEDRRQWQREALELKVWRDSRPDPLTKGLEQLDGYLAGLGLNEGVLVLFDRRTGSGLASERSGLYDARTPGGHRVTVLRA